MATAFVGSNDVSFDPQFVVAIAFGAVKVLIILAASVCVVAPSISGRVRIGAALTLIWQLPLLLLINSTGVLRADYIAHAGQVAVVAQEIRDGIVFPNMTHFAQLVGDPTVSVYGRIYLLSAGYLSLIFGPNLTIRLLIDGVCLLQVLVTYACVRTYSRRADVALCVTALSYWSTYAMNNLYVRGGIAEFLATGLLAVAVALLMLWWHPRSTRRFDLAAGVALCYGAAALTHPITAVWGAVLLAIVGLGLIAAFGASSRQLGMTAGIAIGIGVLVAPWVFLMIIHSPIEGGSGGTVSLTRYAGLDQAWLRLLPFPLSRLPAAMGHPYFVTQMNALLALFGVWMLVAVILNKREDWRRTVVVAGAFLALGGLVFFISVNPSLDRFLPLPLRAAQFSYRFVTYVNLLALVAAVLLSARAFSGPAVRLPAQEVLVLLVVFSAAGVAINLARMGPAIVYAGEPWWSIHAFKEPVEPRYPFLKAYPKPAEVYAYAFSAGCGFAQTPPPTDVAQPCDTSHADIVIAPVNAKDIGVTLPPRPDGPGWATTNVVAYSWNRLMINDVPADIEPFQLFWRVKVPTSGGILQYETVLDPLYEILDRLSIALFVVLLLTLIVRGLRPRVMA